MHARCGEASSGAACRAASRDLKRPTLPLPPACRPAPFLPRTQSATCGRTCAPVSGPSWQPVAGGCAPAAGTARHAAHALPPPAHRVPPTPARLLLPSDLTPPHTDFYIMLLVRVEGAKACGLSWAGAGAGCQSRPPPRAQLGRSPAPAPMAPAGTSPHGTRLLTRPAHPLRPGHVGLRRRLPHRAAPRRRRLGGGCVTRPGQAAAVRRRRRRRRRRPQLCMKDRAVGGRPLPSPVLSSSLSLTSSSSQEYQNIFTSFLAMFEHQYGKQRPRAAGCCRRRLCRRRRARRARPPPCPSRSAAAAALRPPPPLPLPHLLRTAKGPTSTQATWSSSRSGQASLPRSPRGCRADGGARAWGGPAPCHRLNCDRPTRRPAACGCREASPPSRPSPLPNLPTPSAACWAWPTPSSRAPSSSTWRVGGWSGAWVGRSALRVRSVCRPAAAAAAAGPCSGALQTPTPPLCLPAL